MLRRRAALLAALLVGTGLASLVPSGPASATTPTVCAGIGAATVPGGLLYPIGTPQVTGGPPPAQTTVLFHNTHRTSGWTFNLLTGACTDGTNIAASGNLQGYCGHSVGAGATTSGHLVQWFSVGSFLLLTNGVIGAVVAVPDTLAGSSCAQTSLGSLGATAFIIAGAATLTNCPEGSVNLLTTPQSKGLTSQFAPLTFSILDPTPLNLWHVTFSIPHVHWSIHGCIPPEFLK